VAYQKLRLAGVPANVVTVDLNDAGVRVAAGAARGFPYASESFSSILERTRPTAAINGTFFGNANLSLVGDLVVVGKLLHVGRLGTPIAVSVGNVVSFPDLEQGRREAWAGFSSVVCAGPRLLSGGQYVLAAKSEGFRDRRLLGRARRAAIGLTGANKLLLVTVTRSVSLWELAKMMRAAGAVEAVNLDGGSSSALYCQGKTITRPGRGLTNFILVYTDPERYAQYREELAPYRYLSGQIAPANPSLVGKAVGVSGAISIVSPQEGETVTGTVAVKLDTRDKNIQYAVLSVNGTARSFTNTLPYTYQLDSRALEDGEHLISVVGYTQEGMAGPSSEVRVRVMNGLSQAPGLAQP